MQWNLKDDSEDEAKRSKESKVSWKIIHPANHGRVVQGERRDNAKTRALISDRMRKVGFFGTYLKLCR
jgi:hypothetical protein